MALDVVAVEAFTRGRLSRDDDETQRQLDAALAAARTHCGWHVTPVVTDATVALDGPGDRVLVLPTLAVTELSGVTEDGVALDLADLSWSARGLVAKRSGARWTAAFGGVSVTVSHGFDAVPDWESVVLSAIDRGAFSSDSGPRVIGPFQYSDPVVKGLFSAAELAVLDRYALEKSP